MSERIGGVPYGVGAPLLCGLGDEPQVTLVQAPPTELIAQLRRGQLDAALVSSIEAVERSGYRMLAQIGIAARGPVRSVRAFRRPGVPIRSVGLDRSSAASATMLRILLERVLREQRAPDCAFTPIEPTRAPALLPHDLVLLIGDHGLHAEAGGREVWDLGELWHDWTALPFVFAVWLLAPGADAERIVPLLQRAREAGKSMEKQDGTQGRVHYHLGDDEMLGLRRFWAEARALGLTGSAGTEHVPVIVGHERAEGT